MSSLVALLCSSPTPFSVLISLLFSGYTLIFASRGRRRRNGLSLIVEEDEEEEEGREDDVEEEEDEESLSNRLGREERLGLEVLLGCSGTLGQARKGESVTFPVVHYPQYPKDISE